MLPLTNTRAAITYHCYYWYPYKSANNVECGPRRIVEGSQSFFLHSVAWNNCIPLKGHHWKKQKGSYFKILEMRFSCLLSGWRQWRLIKSTPHSFGLWGSCTWRLNCIGSALSFCPIFYWIVFKQIKPKLEQGGDNSWSHCTQTGGLLSSHYRDRYVFSLYVLAIKKSQPWSKSHGFPIYTLLKGWEKHEACHLGPSSVKGKKKEPTVLIKAFPGLIRFPRRCFWKHSLFWE